MNKITNASFLLLLIIGCSPFQVNNTNSSGIQNIDNIDYYFNQFPFPHQITLSDGIAYPPTGDYTGKAYIKIIGPTVFEDLDFDNQKDAVTILEGWFGGTGMFNLLAVVININDQAVNIGTIDLGDRVIINSLSVENKIIFVDFNLNNSNNNVIRYFFVENKEIKETKVP